jgi:hypothetical protein
MVLYLCVFIFYLTFVFNKDIIHHILHFLMSADYNVCKPNTVNNEYDQ